MCRFNISFFHMLFSSSSLFISPSPELMCDSRFLVFMLWQYHGDVKWAVHTPSLFCPGLHRSMPFLSVHFAYEFPSSSLHLLRYADFMPLQSCVKQCHLTTPRLMMCDGNSRFCSCVFLWWEVKKDLSMCHCLFSILSTTPSTSIVNVFDCCLLLFTHGYYWLFMMSSTKSGWCNVIGEGPSVFLYYTHSTQVSFLDVFVMPLYSHSTPSPPSFMIAWHSETTTLALHPWTHLHRVDGINSQSLRIWHFLSSPFTSQFSMPKPSSVCVPSFILLLCFFIDQLYSWEMDRQHLTMCDWSRLSSQVIFVQNTSTQNPLPVVSSYWVSMYVVDVLFFFKHTEHGTRILHHSHGTSTNEYPPNNILNVPSLEWHCPW